jgi:hypothetical protein
MKTFTLTLFILIVITGCSEKIQNATMSWDTDGLVYKNQTLNIFCDSGPIQTNVDSLDEAASILGQYGWEFVSSETQNGEETYHMKRQARTDCTFVLCPIVSTNLP